MTTFTDVLALLLKLGPLNNETKLSQQLMVKLPPKTVVQKK